MSEESSQHEEREIEDLDVPEEQSEDVKGGAFGRIKGSYKEQKPDGSLDAGVQFKYDITANKQL